MIGRALALSALILVAGGYARHGVVREVAPAREALALLPRTLGTWSAVGELPFAPEALALLGVDDYVSRRYVAPADGARASLYIGYYGSQRQGDTIHSPQNCLPGAGWQPVEGGTRDIRVGDATIRVNRYVIEKGADRQIALYWYQGRGRVVANEYANKFWLMLDAARLHRTDGALVRVMVPVGRDGVVPAEAAATSFVQALFPHLSSYLP